MQHPSPSRSVRARERGATAAEYIGVLVIAAIVAGAVFVAVGPSGADVRAKTCQAVADILGTDLDCAAGGSDTAPTPTELFMAGLASCVAFYARRYLARHHIDPAGLTVSASYEIGGRPTRVHGMKIVVTPPAGLPVARRDAFLAVASHCTVHNTLTEPADVEIALAADVVALN